MSPEDASKKSTEPTPTAIPVTVSSNPLRVGDPGILWQFPSSDLEQRYAHVKAILEDIGHLVDMINAQSDRYNKRLLCKFMVVELFSFQENAEKLSRMIEQKGLPPVPPASLATFETVLKKYPTFKTLRNKIGAHRDTSLTLVAAISTWDSMTQDSLNEVVSACNVLFNAIHQSNPMTFRFFNMDGVELKGVFGTQADRDRKPF